MKGEMANSAKNRTSPAIGVKIILTNITTMTSILSISLNHTPKWGIIQVKL